MSFEIWSRTPGCQIFYVMSKASREMLRQIQKRGNILTCCVII